MSTNTKIEWTQGDDGTPGATWNPVTGCTKVSPGCDHCYAETFAERWRGVPGHHFENGFDVTLRPERLEQPHRWRKPRRIFVNSVSDLFHDAVPDEYIAQIWQVMASTPRHTYMILTKRHARMRSWVNRCKVSPGGWITHDGTDPAGAYDGTGIIVGYPYEPEHVVTGRRSGNRRVVPAGGGWPLPNVWLGVSVEDQKWADIRIPALLDTPAAVRFISAEPLLGPVHLGMCDWVPPGEEGFPGVHNPLSGEWWPCEGGNYAAEHAGRITDLPRIDWVIAGGESGPGARPCELEWLRSLRQECGWYGVPFFCKQLGSVLGRELGAGSKGGDIDAFPDDLKRREFPRTAETAAA